MQWGPTPFWKDKDVYIIGGGNSLRDFDWKLLQDLHTIGCNSAYLLGAGICKICVFGDYKWWEENKAGLACYAQDGIVVTNERKLQESDIPWLHIMRRVEKGLATDALAWNGNTGASAINLALILGAKRIFLLGFDMELDDQGRANWHDKRVEKESPEVYSRFIEGIGNLFADLPSKFPGCEIFNVNTENRLGVFSMISIEECFAERIKDGV